MSKQRRKNIFKGETTTVPSTPSSISKLTTALRERREKGDETRDFIDQTIGKTKKQIEYLNKQIKRNER